MLYGIVYTLKMNYKVTLIYIVVDVVGIIIIFFTFKWLFIKHYDKVVKKEHITLKNELESKSIKEIEGLKSNLENKNYIAKTKFDMVNSMFMILIYKKGRK